MPPKKPYPVTVAGQQTNYPCPIMGNVAIGLARCQEACRQPRTNTEKCSVVKCRSPFRLCRNCVLTHNSKPNLAVNPDTGLCKACAAGAEREAEKPEAPVISLPVKAAAAFRPAHGDEHIPVITAGTDPVFIMGRAVFVPTDLVDPLPGQPRLQFDESDDINLAMSIKDNGQLIAGEMVPLNGRYQLTDGERRLRACKRVGFPFKAVVADIKSYAEQKKRSILMNFNRKSHEPVEIALAMRFLQTQIRSEAKQRGEVLSENQVRIKIANMLGCVIGTVTNHLKILDDLDQRVVELLRPQPGIRRPLRLSLALELTSFHDHPEEQFEMAREMVRRNMQLQEGRNFIARKAKEMKISKGRGLERTPAGQREVLETALLRFQHTLTEVLDMSEFELRQMFQRSHHSKYQNVLELARAERDQLAELVEILEAVQKNMDLVPSAEALSS